MHNLTPEEQRTIARYLAESRGLFESFLQYAIYFVPSLVFALYGIWKADFVAVTLAYAVLFGLVVYLLNRQARANPIFRSAIGKLVESGDAVSAAATTPISAPPA